jgi:Sigma-70, region 4
MVAGNKYRPYTRVDHYSRNAEVYRLHTDGWTLVRIAKRYKISRERVRQICRDYVTATRHYEAERYKLSSLQIALINLKAITYQLKAILEV